MKYCHFEKQTDFGINYLKLPSMYEEEYYDIVTNMIKSIYDQSEVVEIVNNIIQSSGLNELNCKLIKIYLCTFKSSPLIINYVRKNLLNHSDEHLGYIASIVNFG